MLNGTVVVDRMALAILENLQGDVPDVLAAFGAPSTISDADRGASDFTLTEVGEADVTLVRVAEQAPGHLGHERLSLVRSGAQREAAVYRVSEVAMRRRQNFTRVESDVDAQSVPPGQVAVRSVRWRSAALTATRGDRKTATLVSPTARTPRPSCWCHRLRPLVILSDESAELVGLYRS